MSLIEDIKADCNVARRAHESDKALSLTTLLSEASMIGKNDGNRQTTDVEVVGIVKKFINNIDFTLSKVPAGYPTAMRLTMERELYSVYLPKQLDENEIRQELTKIKTESNLTTPKGMGELLKTFKLNFEGRYDGAVAARLAKEILA